MAETQGPDPVSPRRCPLWMRLLLIASLAGNLLIAGIVAGAVLGEGERGPVPEFRAARDLGPVPLVMALEREDRRALGRILRMDAQGNRMSREDMRAQFETLLAALRADPFQREAVAGFLTQQRKLAVARQEIGQSTLLERFSTMSLEERRAYADRLEGSLRRAAR